MTGGQFVAPDFFVKCDICGQGFGLCGPRRDDRKFDVEVEPGKRVYRCIDCQDATGVTPVFRTGPLAEVMLPATIGAPRYVRFWTPKFDQFPIGLSIAEARRLANDLLAAADEADQP